MSILSQRFEDQLMRDLTDDNAQDSIYYDYYARTMRELGARVALYCKDVKVPKNPNGKTMGEIHGIKGMYSIRVRIDNHTETTEEYENISMAILKSYQLARRLSASGS